ncbi:hypothetical protein QA600_14375 [Natronococcus sp. A-GB1]|uniref:DUF7115 domain-containing protein n=1 Tax=Natronococcus sp. A-GB1 TaxID=3037648 RepID=UPI00241C9679|nr:hypothetical protein [Natronococcus sp. A-GB1]MDG5760521.1 hypothetical protein [Natronococcus sp. A-GB1]
MTVPVIVRSDLGDEEVRTRVSLGGDDELFVADSSSIVYRAEGLLTDESTEELTYDADRLTLSDGRRKTSLALEYPLSGTAEVTVPASKTDDVLRPVLAGVLRANDVIDPDESLIEVYRFSELTLILTERRLIEHVGTAVWDEGYETYHFRDVTNLSFEEGDVATRIVLEVDGRPQRIKAPNDAADDLRERLKRALVDYYERTSGTDPEEPDPLERSQERVPTGEEQTERPSRSRRAVRSEPARADGQRAAVESRPPMAGTADGATADATQNVARAAVADSTGSDGDDAASQEILERLEALEETVERQNERLEAQQQTIERLIDELRQGR